MFDKSLPQPGQVAGLSDAALIDAMAGWASLCAAADARRLAAIAEFTTRRLAGDEFADWAVDGFEAAAIEVGAALNVSSGMAASQMYLAMALCTRLPGVFARYAAGEVDTRTATTIKRRTDLVQDPDALAALDSVLAQNLTSYGPLSLRKLETAIDLWVTAVDPDAVCRTRRSARDREIGFGDPGDGEGITTIWGRLLATDAKLLDIRLGGMAKAVCGDDPRTVAQRRADALGVLAAGGDRLACACGGPGCPVAGGDVRAASVTVYVLADPEILTAQADPLCHGEDRPGPGEPPRVPQPGRGDTIRIGRPKVERSQLSERGTEPEREAHRTPAYASKSAQLRPAVIVGGSIVPAPLLAELIANGAKVRHLKSPAVEPHPRYRPTAAQDIWVRMRDMTCRAPGCDRPATAADIDHSVPWPAGPTHPSNTKCYCRLHHLAKTFWPGFGDRQRSDGVVEWTMPTGHTYTTIPFSRVLFPAWNTTSAALADPPAPLPPHPARGLKMPKRKRTRAKEREYRINAERALNAERARSSGDGTAPPF
jgi:hypothetical protein